MRQTPILGATGLDFGYKPALSILLPRKKAPLRLFGDDDIGICPEITLVCDRISAAKSKCGFSPFEGDDEQQPGTSGHFYLEKFLDCDIGFSWNSEVTLDIPRYWLTITGIFADLDCESCNEDYAIDFDSGACTWPGYTIGPCGHEILSNEYTTELLISNAEDALPAYDNDFNDVCSAIRNLSADEISYTVSRFKYKFTFPSSSNFRLDWVERFTPEVGGSTDTARTETISGASTETSIYTVNEPTTDGIILIEDIVCTPL